MKFETDGNGFLIGEPIDFGDATNHLLQIKNDVADIKNLLGKSQGSINTGSAKPIPVEVVEYKKPRKSRKPKNSIDEAIADSIAEEIVPSIIQDIAEPVRKKIKQNRAKNGKFSSTKQQENLIEYIAEQEDKADELEKSLGSGGNHSNLSKSHGGSITANAANLAGQGINGLHDADPNVNAFKEIAEPVRRAFGIFGGAIESKEVSWLKKIWKNLTDRSKAESAHDKAELKALKKHGQGGDGESLFGKLLLANIFGKIFTPLAALAAGVAIAPKVMEGVKQAVGAIGDSIMGNIKDEIAGNIADLTIPQTKSYLAEVRKHESDGRGGYRAENKYGYVGAYQMGADALADEGLVDINKLKKAKNGMNNHDWNNGGMKSFLSNNDNWTIPGGKNAFLADKDLQNKTMLSFSNKNYGRALRRGMINLNTPERIASYLMAAHLKGNRGANDLFEKGIDSTDANGTKASTYASYGADAIRNASAFNTLSRNLSADEFVSKSLYVPSLENPTKQWRIPEAPPITNQLNSLIDKPQVIVVSQPNDVGQDISDRSLAHLATGGYSRL